MTAVLPETTSSPPSEEDMCERHALKDRRFSSAHQLPMRSVWVGSARQERICASNSMKTICWKLEAWRSRWEVSPILDRIARVIWLTWGALSRMRSTTMSR